MDKLREEFEEWFIDKYKQPDRLIKNHDGSYKFSGVQMTFSAWEAKSHAAWIDCINEMPQDGVVVLCYEGGDISTLFHRGNGVWDDGDFHSNINGITHWMPLPAAPNRDKQHE
ncbi:DUF551 domain-containing protein [Serratia sp. IR-2025]